MSREPASAVLSDVLIDALAGRRVKTAVFLTFQFDPGFFEEEVLPLLFDQSFSHIPQIRLVQLEERLRSLEHLAVYYDRRGLTAEARPARLDYRRMGVLRHTGYFHPKNIFLLVENQERGRAWDSLLFGTLSANLTKSGWWENVEVAYFTEVQAGQKCTFRRELLNLISRLKQEEGLSEEHSGLEAVRSFLRDSVDEAVLFRRQGRWLPQLYLGQTALPNFLSDFIEPELFNLEIISPYFDQDANSQTLLELVARLQPKATRIFLPTADDGSAQCQQDYFERVGKMSKVSWGRFPEGGTLQASQEAKPGLQPRFVHAKVYRFWNADREVLFVGSLNLTAPAHSHTSAGNFETGMLVELEATKPQQWWLQPLAQETPTQFRTVLFEETEPSEPICAVTFRFDWETETLTYFWESSSTVTPQRAEISAQNVFKFAIAPLGLDRWIALPHEAAQCLKEVLISTSLVEVRADDGEPCRALVREEGMAHKPGLFQALTPEEILHYWSLLSPEQREQFIAQKVLLEIDGYLRPTEALPRSENSMFDRFAGIFHAFGCLETHLREALANGRTSEAEYRLLGEKHDSLPALLEKVIADETADRAHRYVTLLCAGELLDHIEKAFPDFKTQHRPAFGRVRARLAEIDRLEAEFTFDTSADRGKFFAWYREMFHKPAKLPKVEAE